MRGALFKPHAMSDIILKEQQLLNLAATVEGSKQRIEQLEKDSKANQEIIDSFASSSGEGRNFKAITQNFGKKLWEQVQEKKEEVSRFDLSRDAKMNFKIASTMLTSNAIVGSGVNSYNQRLGIVPAQSVNMRDLLTVTPSPTGNFVTYKETNSQQVPGIQTEGQSKLQVEYEFTPATVNSKYLAAFVRVSKQLLYSAPFMTNILPRVLLRDFYKKENDYLFQSIAGNAAGTYTGSSTTDAEELMSSILSLRNEDYEASYSIMDWNQLGRILMTKPQDYSLPAGVSVDNQGNIRMLGTPVIGASFSTSDHVLTFDTGFYELLVTEDLNIAFSYEDNDNFTKNLVTIRIEAFEELNRLRDEAAVYHDFGNSA
jgi:hypothetical protein